MMAQGEPSPTPNYYLARSKQPRHRKSPGGGVCRPGLPRLGSLVEGLPPRRYRNSDSLCDVPFCRVRLDASPRRAVLS